MTCFRIPSVVAAFLVTVGLASPSSAQPSEDLLRYVPRDFGLCLVIQDLRGHAAKWDASPWIQSLKASALGKFFFEAGELKDLVKFQKAVKTHLDIDWPTLRDEVLGEAVVLGYKPGSAGKPDDEQGILLVQARDPDALARLLDKLNLAQEKSNEVKLEPREYRGTKYVRRVEPKASTFYLLNGPLLAFSAKETLISAVIDQRLDKAPKKGVLSSVKRPTTPLIDHLRQSGTGKAVASLWMNPRSFDADINDLVQAKAGADGSSFQGFLKHWKAYDALVLSFDAQDRLEFKLTVLARADQLPAAVQKLYTEPTRPSDVWKHFPDNALFSMAGRIDGTELADVLGDLAPPAVRKSVKNAFSLIAEHAGLDLAREMAPFVGPDWGLCVLPATDAGKMPQVLAALAVQPGPKDGAVDQAMYRGVDFLAGLSMFDYNRRHKSDPILLRVRRQDKVEIKYLTSAKAFPPGVQPAWALKDGYLLLATTPEAILRFQSGAAKGDQTPAAEAPLLRISSKDLAKVFRDHRDFFAGKIGAANQIQDTDAAKGLDEVVSVLNLFDRIELTRSSGAGQTSLVLRLSPAKEN